MLFPYAALKFTCTEQEAAALIPVVETILKTLRTKNAER